MTNLETYYAIFSAAWTLFKKHYNHLPTVPEEWAALVREAENVAIEYPGDQFKSFIVEIMTATILEIERISKGIEQ